MSAGLLTTTREIPAGAEIAFDADKNTLIIRVGERAYVVATPFVVDGLELPADLRRTIKQIHAVAK